MSLLPFTMAKLFEILFIKFRVFVLPMLPVLMTWLIVPGTIYSLMEDGISREWVGISRSPTISAN
jgi:hypothetical protein